MKNTLIFCLFLVLCLSIFSNKNYAEDAFIKSSYYLEFKNRFNDPEERGLLDINFQDEFGRTALMYAVLYQDILMIKNLLNNKARADIQDHWGNTALTMTQFDCQESFQFPTSAIDEYNLNHYTVKIKEYKESNDQSFRIRKEEIMEYFSKYNASVDEYSIEDFQKLFSLANTVELNYSKDRSIKITIDDSNFTPAPQCTIYIRDLENQSLFTLPLPSAVQQNLATLEEEQGILAFLNKYCYPSESTLDAIQAFISKLKSVDPLPAMDYNQYTDFEKFLLLGGLFKPCVETHAQNIIFKREHYDETVGKYHLVMDIPDDEINRQDQAGWTPLMYAVYYNDEEMVKKLIAKKVNLNQQNTYGSTALMIAANSGHHEPVITEMLIDAGAYIHVSDKQGLSAADRAFRAFERKILKSLIMHGARVTVGTKQDLALLLGMSKSMKLTIPKRNYINLGNDFDFTPIQHAIIFGDLETVKALYLSKEIEDYNEAFKLAFLAEEYEILSFLKSHVNASLFYYASNLIPEDNPDSGNDFWGNIQDIGSFENYKTTLENIKYHVAYDFWFNGNKNSDEHNQIENK